MKKIINENDVLNFSEFDPTKLNVFEQNKSDEQVEGYEHINDNKFFIDYSGVTMKNLLEDKGLGDCWSYCNTDTHEIVEAPDTNWLSNIIFELYEIQGLDKKLIISLLEEYFIVNIQQNSSIIPIKFNVINLPNVSSSNVLI